MTVCLSLGQQVTLYRSRSVPENIPIVVTEGNDVKFRCVISGASIIVSVRSPGSSSFGTTLPTNVIVSGGTGDVTVTVVNAQLSDDTMAFQCHGGGLSTHHHAL